ncbi:hypothetical protein AwWohl_04940 [Gammaproteobacteria bacterium]|nr:hypothetical protein AwWohl_04940 [Gammaproteobacteria bacterium]
MKKIIVLKANDNIATALEDLNIGDVVYINDDQITIFNKIHFEHKFALHKINKGEMVIKYGVPIGIAYKEIEKGEHVHLHNLKTLQSEDGIKNLDKEWSNRSS